MNWIKLLIPLPASAAEEVSSILINMGSSGVEQISSENASVSTLNQHLTSTDINLIFPLSGEVTLAAYFKYFNEEHMQKITAVLRDFKSVFEGWEKLEIKKNYVEEEDWLKKWKDDFHALPVGKNIMIIPSWEKGVEKDRKCSIYIDPGMAFGTGHHATTEGCLVLMEKYIQKLKIDNMLDVGTGSGILAIAGIKLGAHSAVAHDIDQDAINVAKKNARINGVEKQICFQNGDLLRISGEYSLVVANILANTLKLLLPDLIKRVKPGGILILSGILSSESDEVASIFTQKEFLPLEELKQGEWVTQAYERKRI